MVAAPRQHLKRTCSCGVQPVRVLECLYVVYCATKNKAQVLMHQVSAVFGPEDTPWEGGIFSLRITFTEYYPEKPPRVRFTSDMFHPNVYT